MKAHIRTYQMCFLTGILGAGLLSFGAGPYGSGAEPVAADDPAVARLPGGAPVSSGEIDAEEGGVWEAYAGMVAAATAACTPSNMPEPETLPLAGDLINQKMRYLSFSAGDPGRLQAVRVTFVNLPAPYDTWNGVVMWVQAPTTYCENSGVKLPPCPPAQPVTDFLGATLDCTPWWGDFHSAGVIHVFHEGIIPGATYVVQVVDSTCDPGQESDYSDPLLMAQSIWGDVVKDCATCPCSPPDGTVGLATDVTAVLDKFRNMEPPDAACAPVTKARADHDWETPNQLVNISDATHCMDAFRGVGYPPPSFTPPGESPCGGPTFVCGNDILEPGEQCDDGNRIPGDGCDENCMSELCGNGAIDGGEECDNGFDNSDTEPDACRTDCTLPRCGDDVVDSGEECDDGSTTPGDGCNENCQIEPFVGDAVISLAPVSSSDPGATIVEEENRIELSSGGHQVFLNIRVSDWDPGATGLQIKAWQAVIDSTGYTSGLQGTLTPYAPTCVDDDDCETLMGPLGWAGGRGGCGAAGWPSGECIPAWIDNSRTDYIMANTSEGAAVDVSTLDFRYGSTASAFSSPGIAELYAGTLAVDVPVDAAGTFVIDFRRGAGDTCLIDQNNYLIPLGGIEPAVITVLTACCLPDGSCDPAMTAEDCQSAGGAIVTECAGDNDGNGIDDACESAACCLSDDTCVELSRADCAAQSGTFVCECLGDDNPFNGIDDACESCAVASTPLAEDGGFGTCSADGDCAGLSVCRSKMCVGGLDDGNPCTADGECDSNVCRGICYVPKNRYISFDPNNASRCVAVQVELTAHRRCSETGEPCESADDCPDPPSGQTCVDTDCVGSTWWVDAPVEVQHMGKTYWISRLTDSPVYRNWTNGVIDVGDVQIVPAAEYAVRAIEQDCDVLVPGDFSAPLTLPTVPRPGDCQYADVCLWADMVGPLQSPGVYLPPDGVFNFEDIVAMIDGFMEWAEAAPPTWTDLMPEVPDMNITGREFLALRRVRMGYPYPGSSPCAGQSVEESPEESEQADATVTCRIVDEDDEPLTLATTGVYMIVPSAIVTLEIFVEDAFEGVTMYQTCVDFKRNPPDEKDDPVVIPCTGDIIKRSPGVVSLGPDCDQGQSDPDVTIDLQHGHPDRDWVFDGLFPLPDAEANCLGLFVYATHVPGRDPFELPPGYLSEYTFEVPQKAGGNVYEVYFVREPYIISADTSELLPRDADGNTTAMSIIVEDPCVKLLVVFDCNENQIPDACDIDCGSQACLDTGWTGECGGSADCNGNAIPDECEIAVDEVNHPGEFFCGEGCIGCPVIVTPALCKCVNTDEDCPVGCDCEYPEGCLTACEPEVGCDPQCSNAELSCDPDCNDNGVPDACDITSAAGDPNLSDCNENCVPDECDITEDDGGFCKGEGGVDCSWDCQHDYPDELGHRVPDECEADCNSDGCPDDCEDPVRADQACGQGVGEQDCDGDGTCNAVEIENCEPTDYACRDCNTNGIPDGCDLDQSDPDGDGWVSPDCQPNVIPDECDIRDCPEGFDESECCADCNDNNIPDGCDLRDCSGDVACEDCNFNGVPDACGIPVNQGGLCDEDDPADCPSCDANANGMPDERECPGASENGACENAFDDGPAAPTTTIDAAFRIEWLNGSPDEFSGLSGSATIWRGTLHFHDDDPEDKGNDQPCLVPPGFPEPHPTDFARSREMHLEMTELTLTGADVSLGLRGSALGETQGTCLDFPADTFFTWYIQATMGTVKLHSQTPIVLRAELSDFDWDYSWEYATSTTGQRRSVFVNDHSAPAIPLFDTNGVHRAYLTRIQLGQGTFPSDSEDCAVDRAISGPVSFAVAGGTTGVDISTPNEVYTDGEEAAKKVRVYVSSGATSPAPPDTTNVRDDVLAGDTILEDDFNSADRIKSLSFGQDGTRDPTAEGLSPILYFSVDGPSLGVDCTDVRSERDRQGTAAADVFASPMPTFGNYAESPGALPSSCDTTRGNCLVADNTALGLGPHAGEGALDNVVGLEFDDFVDGDLAYLTFLAPSFGGDSATIWVYNNHGNHGTYPFKPGNLLSYASAGDLGLQANDVIDALVVSDMTPGTKVCVGDDQYSCTNDGDCIGHGTPEICTDVPDGVWNTGDEVLFSLASGSQTLVGHGWSGAHIFKVTHGQSDSITAANVFLGPAALGLVGGTDDIDAIDVGVSKVFEDCNHNGIDDLCDIARGFSVDELGESGVPDECETACPVPSMAPEPERLPLLGGPISQKVRYISFTASGTGQRQAIRVTFEDLPAPFDVFNGQVMWVDEPTTYCENSGKKTPPCPPAQPSDDFLGATLQCQPYFTDWHGICRCGWCIGGFNDDQTCSEDSDCAHTIHVYNQLIVPDGVYRIDVIDQRCTDLSNQLSYSEPMDINPLLTTTSIWGDVVRDCVTDPCRPPDGEINIIDATAVLDKFRNLVPPDLPCPAIIKTRADIEPCIPDQLVNIADVTYVLDAFQGFAYPAAQTPPAPGWPVPDGCP